MKVAFRAKFVTCLGAIGGEILQVSFDTKPQSMTGAKRKTPYFLLSRNFEFADSSTIEWHVGADYDGGADFVSLRIMPR
jgi:hypothetical protein